MPLTLPFKYSNDATTDFRVFLIAKYFFDTLDNRWFFVNLCRSKKDSNRTDIFIIKFIFFRPLVKTVCVKLFENPTLGFLSEHDTGHR